MMKTITTLILRSSTRLASHPHSARRFAHAYQKPRQQRPHRQQHRPVLAEPQKQTERAKAEEAAEELAQGERVRAMVLEETGLTEYDRELDQDEIRESFGRYDTGMMHTMEWLLKARRPLASFSVARYVAEKSDVSKALYLRALHLTAYAVAEYGGVPETAKDTVEKLRAKSAELTSDLVRPLVTSLLNSMSDAPDTPFDPSTANAMVHDLYAILGCAALRRRDADAYQRLSASNFRLLHSDAALYNAASQLAREDPAWGRLILDEYLEKLSKLGAPLTENVFEEYTKPLVSIRPEWQLHPSEARNGSCAVCQEKLKPARVLTTDEFQTLKTEVENVLFKEVVSRRGGSPRELEALRRQAESEREKRLKDSNTSSVVIDFLNVFHRHEKFSERSFWEMIGRLKRHFKSVYTVGRPFNIYADVGFKQRLKRENVGYFYLSRHSKDDLFTICLALWLGPQTKLLTNDAFADHRHCLPAPTRRLFDVWYRQSVLGFDENFGFNVPPAYSHAVERSANGYHIWTESDRSVDYLKSLAVQRLYCLDLGSPKNGA